MHPELMTYEKVALGVYIIYMMAVVPPYVLGGILPALGSSSRAERVSEWLRSRLTIPAIIGAAALFLIAFEVGARLVIMQGIIPALEGN